jgi:signal transduction histidine kinase
MDPAKITFAIAQGALLAALLGLALALRRARREAKAQARRAAEELDDRVQSLAGAMESSHRELLGEQARAEGLAQLLVHDLRNPLATILANVRLVQEALAGAPGRSEDVELLRTAAAEAVRLSAMIGDLLLVPRLEGGVLGRRLSATEVRVLLDEVARVTAMRAKAKGIRLEVAASAELVALLDPSLSRRMLENLVANSLRHTPRGGRIELSAEVNGDRLRLAVRNTGDPIPASARGLLFQKYSTLGSDEHRTGLGLYLCRLVAEAHGGGIALVERAGWSVSFEADLPLAPERGASGGRTPEEDDGSRNSQGGDHGKECASA